MRTYVSGVGRGRVASWPFQTYALIVATLLLGLVATVALNPQNGDPALIDGIGLFAGG